MNKNNNNTFRNNHDTIMQRKLFQDTPKAPSYSIYIIENGKNLTVFTIFLFI